MTTTRLSQPAAKPVFEVASGEHGTICRLAIAGEVDLSTADDLRTIGLLCLDGRATRLQIDLHDLSFLDSTALGALVSIRNAANELGKTVSLHDVPPRTAKLLAITGLSNVFEMTEASTEPSQTGHPEFAVPRPTAS